jgi:hypothetical protein
MKNLKKVQEVKMIDQFVAMMEFLKAMGYETSELSALDVATLRYDVLYTIDNCKELKQNN